MNAPPRLICCDLGGVVVRICRSWAEGCAAAGLDVRGAVDDMLLGGDGWARLNGRFQSGHISPATFAEGFRDLVDGLYSADEVMRVHDAWLLGEYPGVSDRLAGLRAAGLQVAVLSNTSVDHWATMRVYPFFDIAHARIASHEIGAVKPHADAYAAVEAATGCRAHEILFFDDTAPNVAAALALGWDAVVVDPHGDPLAQIDAALTTRGIRPSS